MALRYYHNVYGVCDFFLLHISNVNESSFCRVTEGLKVSKVYQVLQATR